MGGIGLRPDQVNSIVNTLFAANRKDPRSESRQDSLKTTDGVKNRIHDDFVSSRELKALLNDPYHKVALSLSDPYHPAAAREIADYVTNELDRADGWQDGWIRVADTTWLGYLLEGFSGSRRDGEISREGMQHALEAGRLVIGDGGQLMSPDEATRRGNTLIALHENRDGATLAIFQPNNRVRPRPGDRPSPPPINDRPSPPPIGHDRPSPPPIYNDRPSPPPINDRPVPPPISGPIAPPSYASPAQIYADFRAQKADLDRTYNATPMTQDTRNRLERQLIDRAVGDLLATRGHPFSERKAALANIYNGSSMNSTEHSQIEQRLISDELNYLMQDTRHLPFGERKQKLNALYNGSSMTSTQQNAAEKQLIDQEIDRIAFSRDTLNEKLRQLGALYNGSSMSSSEYQIAQQRVERGHYSR